MSAALLAMIEEKERHLAIASAALCEIAGATCNCNTKLKDGSHYHDCQSVHWMTDAAREALSKITPPVPTNETS